MIQIGVRSTGSRRHARRKSACCATEAVASDGVAAAIEAVESATAALDGAATASTVRAMSADVCAAEMKFASNCDGASERPCAIIAWKKRPNLARSAAEADVQSVTGLVVKNSVHIEPTRAKWHGSRCASSVRRTPSSSSRPSVSKPIVEAIVLSNLSERRQARGHR